MMSSIYYMKLLMNTFQLCLKMKHSMNSVHFLCGFRLYKTILLHFDEKKTNIFLIIILTFLSLYNIKFSYLYNLVLVGRNLKAFLNVKPLCVA